MLHIPLFVTQAFPEGGGYFHCGGSEVFDVDGEVLEIPPPVSRGSGVFDSVVLGEHSYGPGYRHPSNQHERQRSQPGYVVGQLEQLENNILVNTVNSSMDFLCSQCKQADT